MFAFFEYLRNITYYLVFMAAVGVIAPSGNYKKYIMLLMGIILIGAVIDPLSAIIAREPIPLTTVFGGITSDADLEFHDHLRDSFHSQLTAQTSALLERNGFHLMTSEWETSEDLVYIRRVFITAQVKEAEQERVPFIRIEPVRIAPYQSIEQPEDEPQEAQKVKKLISDFYDMDMSNIHVIIQKE